MSSIIKVVAKTFEVLETLNRESNLSLKEITDRVSYPKPTVFRLLNTLSTLGYVEQDFDTQSFALSSKFISFINGTMRGSEIITTAQPYLEDLRAEFNESVNLARLVDNKIVYINALESPQMFRICNNIGDHAAFHSTSVGKVILAFLPEEKISEILKDYTYTQYTNNTIACESKLFEEVEKAREQGYALDKEEGHDGVFCLGAPILNKNHYAFAAISISMPKVRAKKSVITKLTQRLPQITKEISAKLKTNYLVVKQ